MMRRVLKQVEVYNCPLSPNLFILKTSTINLKTISAKYFKIEDSALDTLLSVDDQIIKANSDDDLQSGIPLLSNVIRKIII